MIWSTSYHHVTILVHRSWPHLLFTVASDHRRQVLLKLHRHTRSLALKPPTSLHSCNRSIKPSLILIFSTWSHDSISCLICNELLHHHIITYGLISCVSHINTVSPPKLSLNYQNQTRTFQTIVGAEKDEERRMRRKKSVFFLRNLIGAVVTDQTRGGAGMRRGAGWGGVRATWGGGAREGSVVWRRLQTFLYRHWIYV